MNLKARKQEPIFKLLCLKEKYKPKSFTSEIIYDDLIKDKQENDDDWNSGQDGQPLDNHIYSDGNGSGKPSDFDKFVKEVLGLPDKPNNGGSQNTNDVQSSVQMNNNRIKEAFVQTAKDIGHGSGGIIEQIKEMSKPVISWKRILRKSLNGLNKSEHDPKKLHRRVHGLSLFMKQNNMIDPKLGMYRAGKKPEPVVNVFALFDTSGSISQKEKEIMLSETFGICSQYSSFNLTVACWGTNFIERSLKTFNKQNKNELKDYKFISGGGTDVNCIASYLESQKLKSTDRVVIFTDCYFGDPREKLTKYSKHLIFVSTQKNMKYATRELGRYIEYDNYQ
jgi:predicted metal-dependent peptidase